MVQIHVKQTEDSQFLFNCPSTSSIQDIARDIIQIYNLQHRIQTLVQRLQPHLLPQSKDDRGSDSLALRRALSEAQTYASKDQVQYRKALQPQILIDQIEDIEKELKRLTAFSDSDIIQQLLNGHSTDFEPLHESTAQLWWAGKEILRNKRLCDYVGNNEKTKMVVRLQLPELGPTQSSGSR